MTNDIRKVEEYIDFLTKCLKDEKLSNIRETESIKSEYDSNKKESAFHDYLRFGNHHYFASRVLFLSGVEEYSFFTAQQCRELYLKAYINYLGEVSPDGHDLRVLVKKCRDISDNEFICSDRIMTIAERFNPFYEYSRYPVYRTRPQGGAYSFIYPDDIKPLDYFVFKMREIMTYPSNSYDLVKMGKMQGGYNHYTQDASTLFQLENINFNKSLDTIE